jgi:hypothetical protein
VVEKICAAVECDRPVFTKKSGLCQSHYLYVRRGGDISRPIRTQLSLEEKIGVLAAVGFSPLAEFPGSKEPWLVRCPKGHECKIRFDRIDSNEQLCDKCRHPSLAQTHPHLKEWWDLDANKELRFEDLSKGSEQVVVWKCPLGHSPKASVYTMTSADGPRCGVCRGRQIVRGVNDLASQSPEVAALWDSQSNKIGADAVYYGSMQTFFWRCSRGHRYERSPFDQRRSILRGADGCRFCRNTAVWEGDNDLLTVAPHLVKDYLRGKNPVPPSKIGAFTSKKVMWQCSKKHQPWSAPVNRRTRKNTGCAVCARIATEQGFNDALTANPALSAIWSAEENGQIEILANVAQSSAQSFRWKCLEFGHTYSATVINSIRGVSCGVCSGRELLSGFNDLGSSNLAGEFDFDRTVADAEELGWSPIELDPAKMKRSERRRVYWRCRTNSSHSWDTVLSVRFRRESGCPMCAGNILVVGENDLQTKFPELCTEWSSRNTLLPNEVSASSRELVWWVCPVGEGHPEYRSVIHNRTGVNSTGCPDCNTGGFETAKSAYLYLIKHTELQALKIGISNSDSRPNRVNVWKQMGWELIQIWEHDYGSAVRNTEQEVLRTFVRGVLNLPPILSKEEMGGSGQKETFDLRPLVVEAVTNQIDQVLAEKIEEDRTRRNR